MSSITTHAEKRRKSNDFRKFWVGETISNLGSSFTLFALPLLVFKLTGSALDLGIATAVAHLPYLFFGLILGAWADRLDRKRTMILVDVGQALIIASIPVLYLLGALSVWWIYVAAFLSGTLKLLFDACQFAALPGLVDQKELAVANGRIQASFYGASILGPLLAGWLLFVMPVPVLLFVDAASFLVSALLLSLVSSTFNLAKKREQKSIWHDIVEGLGYLFRHPVLRTISLMLVPVNFLSIITTSQLVLFSQRQLAATDSQFALINAAGGAGVIVAALLIGRALKRWSFTRLLLPTLALHGLALIAMSFTTSFWQGMLVWAFFLATEQFFNICTASLRQTIVPNEMLGRVQSVNAVICYLALPLGSLTGGAVIKTTDNVMLVYLGVGVGIVLVSVVFAFTSLGRADRYLPTKQEQPEPEASVVAEK